MQSDHHRRDDCKGQLTLCNISQADCACLSEQQACLQFEGAAVVGHDEVRGAVQPGRCGLQHHVVLHSQALCLHIRILHHPFARKLVPEGPTYLQYGSLHTVAVLDNANTGRRLICTLGKFNT